MAHPLGTVDADADLFGHELGEGHQVPAHVFGRTRRVNGEPHKLLLL